MLLKHPMFYYSKLRIPLWPFLFASILSHSLLSFTQWQRTKAPRDLPSPAIRQLHLVARSLAAPPQPKAIPKPKPAPVPIPAIAEAPLPQVDTPTDPIPASAEPVVQDNVDSVSSSQVSSIGETQFTTHNTSPTTSTVNRAALRAAYLAELSTLLESNKHYPPAARRLRQQGTSRVRFRVLADGSLEELGIAQSAGFDALDTSTRSLVQRLGRHRPIPAELEESAITLEVDVHYVLQ